MTFCVCVPSQKIKGIHEQQQLSQMTRLQLIFQGDSKLLKMI